MYNGHTKEVGRACHDKPVNTKMEHGQDPDDFFFVLPGCRDLLEKTGQTVHDKRYKDILLQAVPAEYERVQNASYENGTLDWWIFGTWYIPCSSTAFRILPTPSRLPAAASPCRNRAHKHFRAV